MLYSKEKETNFTSHIIAHDILKKFDSNNRLVFSTTWTSPEDLEIVSDYIQKNPNNRVLIVSTFDQDLYLNFIHDNVTHINCNDFCFWLLVIEKHFIKYDVESVLPEKLINKFITYQRKVYDERTLLYESLKDKQGIITIGNKTFDSININLPDHPGYNEIGGNITIANDIYSLGNIDIWKSSFLNIVVETTQDLKKPTPFFSEKTFKPIIGMRPFIAYGHPKTTQKLKEMGFETFDDDFGYKQTDDYGENAKRIIDVIDSLDDLDSLYKKLYPKILHNKNVLNQVIKNEWNKLETLINNI